MRWSTRPWRIGRSFCDVGARLRSRMSRAAVVAVPRRTWPRLSWRVATARDCFSLLIARSAAVGCGHRPRADGRARWWSPPRCPRGSRPRRRPGPAAADAPASRRPTTADGVHALSSTGRSAREDPATALLQPDPGTGVGRLRLRTDRNTAIQLTAPKLQYGGGHTVIESKNGLGEHRYSGYR